MTDRLHFADLTAITAPFGLLDDDTQQRLRAWPHGATFLTVNGSWAPRGSMPWYANVTYRARPAPLVPDYVDWSQVGPAVNHFARNEDGVVCGFECEPRQNGRGWWSDRGTLITDVDRLFPSYNPGTVKWFNSLISRPEVEG